MLVDHEDPGRLRLVRRVQADGFAIDADLALVGPVHPREDVAERGLAGAVLPEERVHLAASRLERDAVVGNHATGEALGHADSRHRRG